MTVYIGTSGFSYHHWTESFYPKEIKQSGWLRYYAHQFNTVELNTSFYRLPSVESFQRWYDETPEGFIFAMKGSRYITHTKKLLSPENSVGIFFERAKALRDKLPVILWQLPPSFKSDPNRLENFLKVLQKYDYRQAFEFRHESWFKKEIFEILARYNAALVKADSPEFPRGDIKTSDFSYVRFHGGRYLYSSKYSLSEMKVWSENIRSLSALGDVYAYFNNDANAYAVKNALEIKKLLE